MSPFSSDLGVRIDWLQFTIPCIPVFEPFRRFSNSLAADLHDELIQSSHGVVQGRAYSRSARSVRGLLVAYNPPDEVPGDGFVGIPGDCLRALSGREVWRLCNWISAQSLPVRFTRVDVALDDFTRGDWIPAPSVVLRHAENGDYCRYRSHSFTGSYDAGATSSLTVYFGSRHSDRFVRFYDKSAESQGLIDSHRLELVSRGSFAGEVVSRFVSSEWDDSQQWSLTGWISQAIDFRDRSSAPAEVHLDRLPRVEWWDRLSRVLSSVSYSVPVVKPLLADKLWWLDQQVSPTLAIVREVYGSYQYSRYVKRLADVGLSRLREDQLALIRLARLEIQDLDSDPSTLRFS